MSHSPERKEKNCLNCNTLVHGRFCHVCGQENIETKESFWSLSKHFVYDILHFDGKFFHTVKYLFTRPGYVPRQYAEGKRASYLHPIRMYLFTSAIFFLIFFSLNDFQIGGDDLSGELDNKERVELANQYRKRIERRPQDSLLRTRIFLLLDTAKPLNIDSLGWQGTPGQTTYNGHTYTSVHQYDSLQATLSEEAKDGWVESRFIRQSIKTGEKYGTSKGLNTFVESFVHKLPYMLFLSLPFFALILKLLYVRRKNFYYSDHAVFTLYHYICTFILLLLIFGINALQSSLQWGVLSYLQTILGIAWPFYLFLEMKNFYRQRFSTTLGKFLLLNFLGIIVIFLIFLFFLLFSFFQNG